MKRSKRQGLTPSPVLQVCCYLRTPVSVLFSSRQQASNTNHHRIDAFGPCAAALLYSVLLSCSLLLYCARKINGLAKRFCSVSASPSVLFCISLLIFLLDLRYFTLYPGLSSLLFFSFPPYIRVNHFLPTRPLNGRVRMRVRVYRMVPRHSVSFFSYSVLSIRST